MKVLIAAGNEDLRIKLRACFEGRDDEIVETENGFQAWKTLWTDHPPRLALIQWRMPEMDGSEICERIQQNKNLPFIYTMLIGTGADNESFSRAMEIGALDFISLPVDREVVQGRMAVATRLIQAEDKLKLYAEELRKTSEEIKQLITADYLTGVYNRRHFLEQAVMELERALRYGRCFSVLLIDIDHFKQINETYGHLAGDEALKEMMRVASDILRRSDLIARYGGEEFVILLPETSDFGAFELAERLRRTVEQMVIDFEAHTFQFTISIGISSFKSGDQQIEMIMNRADEALREAKSKGRNQTVMK